MFSWLLDCIDILRPWISVFLTGCLCLHSFLANIIAQRRLFLPPALFSGLKKQRHCWTSLPALVLGMLFFSSEGNEHSFKVYSPFFNCPILAGSQLFNLGKHHELIFKALSYSFPPCFTVLSLEIYISSWHHLVKHPLLKKHAYYSILCNEEKLSFHFHVNVCFDQFLGYFQGDYFYFNHIE